jgi:orotate phosphoribosyltransferase
MSDYTDSYIGAALDPATAPHLHKAVIKYIRSFRLRFDTIVCRGTSGLLVAPIVAQKMHKELIVVRKSDGNHSGKLLEGFKKARNFIIIDDFICTGNTVNAMLEAMHQNQPMAKCVAIVGWRASGDCDFKWTSNDKQRTQEIPRYSVWPNDDCTDFTYAPAMVVRKPKPEPAPVPMTPATEAEKYFHKAAAVPVQGTLAIS